MTRRGGIRILERGRADVSALFARLSPRQMNRSGIGGGRWSPKDLVGHLAAWEGFAVEALRDWERGLGWRRDRELSTRGIDVINRAGLERNRRLSAPEVGRRADATHAELIGLLTRMSDARWDEPATSRGRKPLGDRLGSILGGPGGPFRHNEAHLKDLRAFVDRWGS